MPRINRTLRLVALLVCVTLMAVGIPAATSGAADASFLQRVLKLVAADGATYDWFGMEVAVSGDTAVIGAPGDNSGSGSAYVFARSGTVWVLQQKLVPLDAVYNGGFGNAVATSGDTVVVGAPYDDDKGPSSGSAYVYTRSGDTWSQQGKLLADDGAPQDAFGSSVAISDDTVAVGSAWDDDTASASGSAYVFTRTGGTWSQQQKLTTGDGLEFQFFGNAIAVEGDTVLVGADGDDENGPASGSAYVFTRTGATWSLQQKLTPDDGVTFQYFGIDVALSGETAIVGTGEEDTTPGSAYAFTRTGGTWSQQQKLVSADGVPGDMFGSSVAMSGDTALVGAVWDADKGAESGSAYAFTRSAGVWTQAKKLTAPDGAASDWFGSSVGLAGDTAFVGAYGDDEKGAESGSVYVFGPPVTLTPVYRFYRPSSGTHFYTPNEAEKAYVIATWPTIYKYEGVAYGVNPDNNTQPLYRFYNKRNGSHFYTASETEKANVIANLSATYSYDGPTYKVSTAAAVGKPPVYRFYNKRNGSHFYTASEAEKANVIANLSATYKFEGTAFWLGQ